jgi:hypothetical protein
MFSQLLSLFPRSEFEKAVRAHRADRAAKGFDCWTQFVAMLFCQLGRAHSLREICGGLASVEGKLNHLGVGDAPKRSTLSYANAHRPWQLFEEVFMQLLGRCQGIAAPKPFRFKNKLFSLDATVIDLCLEMFDWAKFRRAKGAIKLHLLLDHDGCLPCFGVITEGKTHEIRVARTLDWPKGSIVAIDRGYMDYAFLDSLTERDIFFVTRLKGNATPRTEAVLSAPKGNILSDERINLPGSGANRTARIAILLLKYPQMRSHLGWSLSNLVALLRLNLLVHRDLWAWIHEPYAPPPDTPDVAYQPELALA